MNEVHSRKLDEAIMMVTDAFRCIERKGSGVPYLTHLMQVMVTVAEAGGDEEQMIAALLHDYLEDIEGATNDDVESRFGKRVLRMVLALSDSTTHPKPPWLERKKAYLAHLKTEQADVKLISCADKLHNSQSILRDRRLMGDAIYDRFTATKEQTHWYYEQILVSLSHEWDSPLLLELRKSVDELITG